MKICHISDIHLGYGQYYLKSRFDDFANSLMWSRDLILEEDPDLILISGDFFHYQKQRYVTLRYAREFFDSIKKDKVAAITGNHCHTSGTTWIEYFNVDNDFPFVHKFNWGANMTDALKSVTMDNELNIFMFHDGLRNFGGNISKKHQEILTSEFDYVSLGHIHLPYNVDNIYNPGCFESTSTAYWDYAGGAFVGEINDINFIPYPHRRKTYRIKTKSTDQQEIIDLLKAFDDGCMIELEANITNSMKKRISNALPNILYIILKKPDTSDRKTTTTKDDIDIYEEIYYNKSGVAKLVVETSFNPIDPSNIVDML